MPADARTTRDRLLVAAYDAFYEKGFARVSVDAIAEAASVTKRTLYYHFESKDALAAAALEVQNDRVLAQLGRWAPGRAISPEAVAEALFDDLSAWAAAPRWTGSGFTRITMELADLPGHPARATASRHKAAFEARLAALFDEAGALRPAALARQILLLIEGAAALILIHGDRAYLDDAKAAASALAQADAPAR